MKILKYLLFFTAMSVWAPASFGAPAAPIMPVIRNSVFSTSTDWESVSGLRFSQYMLEFNYDKALVGSGLELYFMDSFPCFGQTDSSRIWIGNNKTSGKIRLTCLFLPEKITFAWRNAAQNESQGTNTGILNCPVSGASDLKIDLSNCVRAKNWEEYK